MTAQKKKKKFMGMKKNFTLLLPKNLFFKPDSCNIKLIKIKNTAQTTSIIFFQPRPRTFDHDISNKQHANPKVVKFSHLIHT